MLDAPIRQFFQSQRGLTEQVTDWRDAGIWFCGPTPFGQSLQKDLVAMGLPEARFHQELFQMR